MDAMGFMDAWGTWCVIFCDAVTLVFPLAAIY